MGMTTGCAITESVRTKCDEDLQCQAQYVATISVCLEAQALAYWVSFVFQQKHGEQNQSSQRRLRQDL